MKRGRKTTSTSGYVMNKHKNGLYFYAYTLRPFEVDGKMVYRRCQWGRLDKNLKFTPGLSFLRLPQEEKVKFVFPDEWDLSEIADVVANNPHGNHSSSRLDNQPCKQDNVSGTGLNQDNYPSLFDKISPVQDKEENDYVGVSSGNVGESTSSSNSQSFIPTNLNQQLNDAVPMLCGLSWLVEIWAKKIGLTDDLYMALNEDKEFVDIILSLLAYAMIFNYSLDNISETQSYARYATTKLLTEKELENVIGRFGDREFEKFFQLWVKRSLQGQICAFDSTLTGDIHEDSDPLGIRGHVFRYGYDYENALKSEFIIIYSLSSGYPLCYLNYGEDNDEFPSYSDALNRFKLFGIDDYVLFTNRKYDGVHLQVDILASGGQKLIMPMENSSPDMELIVSKVDVEDHVPMNMLWDERANVYYSQYRCDIVSGKKIGPDSRISLYYSPEKDIHDRMKIQRRISLMYANVESLAGKNHIVYKEDFSNANNLIDIEYSPANADPHFSVVRSGTVNKNKVKELTNMCGFYALRSFNLDMNPKEITDILRFASERKKDFGILKDLLNLQRPYDLQGEASLKKIVKGKRFVLFLTRIIYASLYRAYTSNKRLSNNFRDVTQLMMEMSSIRAYYKGDKLVGCTPLTPNQRIIIEELNLHQYPGKHKSEAAQMLQRGLSLSKEK